MANRTDTVNTELRDMLPPIQAAQVDVRIHVSATLKKVSDNSLSLIPTASYLT